MLRCRAAPRRPLKAYAPPATIAASTSDSDDDRRAPARLRRADAHDAPRCGLPVFTSSAFAKSPALANRSAGVFASAFATAASTLNGTVSRSTRRCVGFSVISFAIIDCALAPVTGGSPASIS